MVVLWITNFSIRLFFFPTYKPEECSSGTGPPCFVQPIRERERQIPGQSELGKCFDQPKPLPGGDSRQGSDLQHQSHGRRRRPS